MTATLTRRRRLVALTAAWLFDGTSAALVPEPCLIVDEDRIVAVGHGIRPPATAEVVELAGATLLPGLIDTHVHLCFDASADVVGALAARDEDAALAAMRCGARTALRGGITTVRDLGDRGYLALRLRDTDDLPAVVAAGPPITTPGGHCHFLGGATGDPVAAVREHADRGVDVIKVMASGGTLTPGTRQDSCQFTAGVLRAAVGEAHRHGLPVVAHAHATGAVRDALDAGVDGIEHATFWTEDGVDRPLDLMHRLAGRRTVVGATVGMRPVPGATPPPAVKARMAAIVANVRLMHELGVRIVAGTDAGIGPIKPPDVLRYAPPALADVGFTPADALRAVTSVAAQVLGLAQRKGRLAPGFDADILAVDGNPLTDATALHRVRAVYARGREVTR